MNELTITTNTINELSNGALRKECRNYLTAINGISKSRWKCARAIANIVNGEFFKDDFETKRKFYAFVGLKESNGSQLISAQAVNEEFELDDKLSVGKCYAISTLGGEAKEFIDTYTLDELMSMSDKAVVEAVRDWKSQDEPADVEDDEPAEVVDEATGELDPDSDEDFDETDKETCFIIVTQLMDNYGITLEQLSNYILNGVLPA